MGKTFTFDHEKLHINLAKLKREGVNFEVPIDADKAADYLEGRSVELAEVLQAEHIFEDTHRGMRASEANLQKAFGTTDVFTIADVILHKGEIQLTAEHRKKQLMQKQKQIINIIHRNGVDPATKLPHPPDRIERAMEEAKVHIHPSKPVEEQVQEILKKLLPILPIRFEVKEVEVRVPQKYASAFYPHAKRFGKLIKSQWESSGAWYGVIELPGGMEEEFYDLLNQITHGNNTTRILKES